MHVTGRQKGGANRWKKEYMCTTGWPEDSRRGEWYVEMVLGERRGKEMEGRRLKREIFFLRNIEGELNFYGNVCTITSHIIPISQFHAKVIKDFLLQPRFHVGVHTLHLKPPIVSCKSATKIFHIQMTLENTFRPVACFQHEIHTRLFVLTYAP